MVASAPWRTGSRSMLPNSTARYMIISFFCRSFGSARAAGAATRTTRRRPRIEAGAEEDERPVAVAGGQVFHPDAARVGAVGADVDDRVVVTHVLGAAVGGLRGGALIAGEGVGHLARRPRAQVPGTARVAGILVVVRRDV